jgi:hypothetical protein
MNNAQTALLPKFQYSLGQGLVADAASKLPVEDVNGHLAKGTTVDVFNRPTDLGIIEQGPLDLFSIPL